MSKSKRSISFIALLLVLALFAAACGGSSGAGTTVATPTLEPVPADVLARQMAAYVGPIGTLQSPNDVLTIDRNLEGITQAVDLTGGSPPCPGWVDTVPSYVFDLMTDLSALQISFAGTDLSTLMVVTPGGQDILCTNLEGDTITVTPTLEIPQPDQGRYMVYVGRGSLTGVTAGTLTVSGR